MVPEVEIRVADSSICRLQEISLISRDHARDNRSISLFLTHTARSFGRVYLSVGSTPGTRKLDWHDFIS
jgi:hypothetical protein